MPCRPSRIPSGPSRFVLPGPNPGLRVRGNIDLWRRPFARDPRGGISTVRSISFGNDLGEVLIPTVVGTRVVSDRRAMAEYDRTGKHLGIFAKPSHAVNYALRLHRQQAEIYCLGRI